MIKVLIIILIIVLLLLIIVFRNYVNSIEEQNRLLSEGTTRLLELEKINMDLIHAMYGILEELDAEEDDSDTEDLQVDEVEEGYKEV